jgi:hypothetical protein
MNGGELMVVVAVLAVTVIKVFQGPLGSALADRLSGRAAAAVDNEETSQRVSHLEARLAELEERLDFAERLLTKAKEQPGLPGGTGA